ncbi:MAG TPA: aspartyl/asparaginyl beta-hydroxylase domain-containing protein [Steroidobacteraceae bacterium]|nr:aspartyl/asparaginyl beta-hydroxylase domain-containing protein [Steroidobacteraceae bacterium]
MSTVGSIDTIAVEARRAFAQQRYAEAAAGYEQCIALAPQAPAFHFNLGSVREQQGDLVRAVDAYLAAWRLNPRNAQVALFAGAALEATGRREDAAIMFSLGDDIDLAVRRARNRPDVNPGIRRRSATADRVMREHFTRLHALAVSDFELQASKLSGAPPDISRVRGAIWIQTHDGPIAYRTPDQQPSIFYMPDLPAMPITPRERLLWASAIEAKTAEVREEYLAAVAVGTAHAPYVDANLRDPLWRELSGNLAWSSLHLYKANVETPFARLFPKTLAALEAVDIVRVEGRPVELFFSRLRPGAHIPPHFGAANNRITLHLPLLVPGDSEIRVGKMRHAWREGELFAFDDSFEHEAWNRAAEDRVVLIFEAHHPDLSATERAAIEHAYGYRGRWLKERRVPA